MKYTSTNMEGKQDSQGWVCEGENHLGDWEEEHSPYF